MDTNKFNRGLILPPNVVEKNGSIIVRPTDADTEKSNLRMGALYFDSVVYPVNRMIYVEYGDPSFESLKNAGFANEYSSNYRQILSGKLPDGRPLFGGSTADTFLALNTKNPSCWSIAGADSNVFESNSNSDPNAIIVELLKKLPMPSNQSDPMELLSINAKHRKELLQLRSTISSLALNISIADNQEAARKIIYEGIEVNLEKISEVLARNRISTIFKNLDIGVAFPPLILEGIVQLLGGPSALGVVLGSAISVSLSYSPFGDSGIEIPPDFAYLRHIDAKNA